MNKAELVDPINGEDSVVNMIQIYGVNVLNEGGAIFVALFGGAEYNLLSVNPKIFFCRNNAEVVINSRRLFRQTVKCLLNQYTFAAGIENEQT